jgi:hypothetical protein
MNTQHESQQHSNSRSRLVLLAFLAIAAFFLLTEHRAHLLGLLPWLPWLLLLACPLLHLFMHRGHDGHGEDEETSHKRGQS